MRTQVWSCGGGTQSAAIAGLIVEGRLPKPDIALMVDTEREKSTTWEYVNGVLRPALAGVGVDLVIVTKSDFSEVDLWTGTNHLLMPMFTNQSGEPSKLPTYCSDKWKRRVAQRYLRSVGVKQCDVWLGMSCDEVGRVRASNEPWYQHKYPLVTDVMMRRRDCIEYVVKLGWPQPPRSACWMCPNQSQHEWLRLRKEAPADFALAVELEREILKRDPHAFLHKSCVPLDQVDFDAQGDLFADDAGCSSGYCFT